MSESIKVICRVRPLNKNESNRASKVVLSYPGDGKSTVCLSGKNYTFDHVFQPKSSQSDIYDIVAKPIVESVLNGYNGTIFAYGQTSSGKTYTMEGLLNNTEKEGIIPRIIHDIFNHIYEMDENLEFHIKVSYFEIYMEKIRDLLDVSKTNLSVHEDKMRVPYVKGATERFVSKPEEVFVIIEEGKVNRHVSVTNMNEHSSRSHSVFMIQVRQENLETQKKLHGKLYLVDLAGSEKVSKTGAEGVVLDEAKNINKSLSSLGNVINALVEKYSHVPYRESKLTRILQESLGGNARTTMIICCSPAEFNESETKGTLMFGMRAKTIKNCVQINEEVLPDEWRRMFEEEKTKTILLQKKMEAMKCELKTWKKCQVVRGEKGSESDKRMELTLDKMDYGAMEIDEETLSKVYQQLDDKDGEINQYCQKVNELELDNKELNKLVESMQTEISNYQEEIRQQQVQIDANRTELKEVLLALEEMAMKGENRRKEFETKSQECQELQKSVNSLTKQLSLVKGDVNKWDEKYTEENKKFTEMLMEIMHQVTGMSLLANEELPVKFGISSEMDFVNVFDSVKQCLSKVKTDIENQSIRLTSTEEERNSFRDNSIKLMNRISEMDIQIKELESKISHQQQRIEELQTAHREMTVEVDQLRSDNAKLLLATEMSTNENNEVSLREKLDEELQHVQEDYTRHLRQLREEITIKSDELEKEQNRRYEIEMVNEKLKTEHEFLLEDNNLKTQRLNLLEKQSMEIIHKKAELQNEMNTVSREMHNLHNVRRIFVQELRSQLKKVKNIRRRNNSSGSSRETNDETTTDSSSLVNSLDEKIQDRKFVQLEKDLENISKVHKELVRENMELRGEIPILEKRLKATIERVKELENALMEAKDLAFRERQRYQNEIHRIRDHVRQRTIARVGSSALIAKPIRAGPQNNAAVAAVASPRMNNADTTTQLP